MSNLSRIAAGTRLTPMQKAVGVNTNLGNPSIKNQQGTSRVLYDTLPLDGRQEFKFFENVGSRTFPRTNINQNRLQVGETFTLMRIIFSVIVFDAVTGAVTDVTDITTAGLPELYAGDFSVFYDTVQVIKPYPLQSQLPKFGHTSWHGENEWICFDNYLVVPSDIQFRCELDVDVYAAVANSELRCTWEGFGTILSPKTQF